MDHNQRLSTSKETGNEASFNNNELPNSKCYLLHLKLAFSTLVVPYETAMVHRRHKCRGTLHSLWFGESNVSTQRTFYQCSQIPLCCFAENYEDFPIWRQSDKWLVYAWISQANAMNWRMPQLFIWLNALLLLLTKKLMDDTEISMQEGGVHKSVDHYCGEFMKIKTSIGQMWFSALAQVIVAVFSLSHSNADCLIKFSVVRKVHTQCRQSLDAARSHNFTMQAQQW